MKHMLLAAWIALACGPALGQTPVDERRELSANGFVEIEAPAGTVKVVGAPDLAIRVTGTGAVGVRGGADFASVRASGGAVDLSVRVPANSRMEIRGDSLNVDARALTGILRVSTRRGWVWVSDAPREVQVEAQQGAVDVDVTGSRVNVTSVQGAVRLSARQAEADVSTVSGPVTVRGAGINGRFQTVSGNVDVTASASRVSVSSGSGLVALNLQGGEVDVTTTSGSIEAQGDRFDRGQFESYTGRIRFESGPEENGQLRFKAGEGAVDLRIPGASNEVVVRTQSGPIHVSGDGFARGWIESRTGDVVFEGNLQERGALDVQTAGAVDLVVPEDVNARFRIAAQGAIHNAFGQAAQAGELDFSTGRGSAWIAVKSRGDVRVRKRPDSGKPRGVIEAPAGPGVDVLYAAAMARIGTVTTQESIQEMARVVAADRKYAPAHHQLARLYMSLDTPGARQQAEGAIRRALQLDRDNLEYHLTLGEVFWEKGMWRRAAAHFEEVLARHPDVPQAAFQIGFYALKEFLRVQEMVNPDTVTIHFGQFADPLHRQAVEMLERCIALSPDFREAYYQLGVAHQESRNPDGLIAVSERLLARFPEDKDALLFAALGYQTRGDYARAADFYGRALARMGAQERAMMEAVDLIAEDEEEKLLASATASDTWRDEPAREKFWKRRNPLFLTDYNERRMAHYGRVAYANLRFTKHSADEAGWQTDMGRAWIKFGRYVARRAIFRSLNETWYYEDFELGFSNRNGLDDFAFSVALAQDPLAGRDVSVGGDDLGERLERPDALFARRERLRFGQPAPSSREVFQKTPPRYVDVYVTRKFSLPHQVVAFKAGDSVRVEVAYGVPQEKLQDADGVYRLTKGIFAFDADWNDVVRQKQGASLVWPAPEEAATEAGRLRQAHLIEHQALAMGPGARHLLVEVMDDVGQKIGTLRRDETFSFGPGLTVTEPLLATQIRPLRPDVRSRSDVWIAPNPLRVFGRTEPVNVYFEMYNLQRDVFGRTRYDVSYEIRRPKGPVDPALFQAVDLGQVGRAVLEEVWPREGDAANRSYRVRFEMPDREALEEEFRALVRQADKQVTRVTAEYEGERADDVTYLAIDVRQMPLGIYELVVEVKDRISGEVSRRAVVFQVVE